MKYSYLENFSMGVNLERAVRERGFIKTIKLLNENNINYVVMYGSLLGLIREGKLLETDNDVDILVHKDDIEKAVEMMKKAAMPMDDDRGNIKRHISDKYGLIEFYIYEVHDDYLVDLWSAQQAKGRPNYVYRFKKDDILPFQNKNYYGLLPVSIPRQPEKVLASTYGPSWRIPRGGNDYQP